MVFAKMHPKVFCNAPEVLKYAARNIVMLKEAVTAVNIMHSFGGRVGVWPNSGRTFISLF